jgi:hypothetical protein
VGFLRQDQCFRRERLRGTDEIQQVPAQLHGFSQAAPASRGSVEINGDFEV